MHRERLIITCELEIIRHKNELLRSTSIVMRETCMSNCISILRQLANY